TRSFADFWRPFPPTKGFTMAAAPRQAWNAKYLDPSILKKIGPLDVVARQVVEGLRIGMHQSPLRGISTEFTAYRPYSQGDETRHVDWKVYARTHRYYVKLFEAETNFEANLLLDASSSMRYGSGAITKLEYAKYLAASLAYLIVDQNDSVGLGVFDDELRRYIPPKSSRGVVLDISRELEQTESRLGRGRHRRSADDHRRRQHDAQDDPRILSTSGVTHGVLSCAWHTQSRCRTKTPIVPAAGPNHNHGGWLVTRYRRH
ncbi:MAG: DUF58 domain-containing protein, partial [Planctomycetia bacterium]|nr:DUF58 domain-containing protein [Planctomycetia bacterium]